MLAVTVRMVLILEQQLVFLEELMKTKGRDFEFVEFIADIYSWAERHDKAIELYEKLISNNYKVEDITLKLADELRYAGRNEEAIELYQKYLRSKE